MRPPFWGTGIRITYNVFFDTNILLILLHALVPASDFTRDSRVEAAKGLLARGGAVSGQVLHEFYGVARRKPGKDWKDIRGLLDPFL